MTSHLEVERTFSLEIGQRLPDLGELAVVSGPRTFELAATYYDTRDLNLSRARITLRRRRGGHDEGWHLKLPGARPEERQEYHSPLGDSLVPPQLRALVAGFLADHALLPVARLDTRRTEWDLLDPEGTIGAVVCSDAVLAVAGGQTKAWQELEVELVNAADDLLDRAQALLARHGIHPAEIGSKAAVALAPLRVARDRASEGPPSAWDAVADQLSLHLGVLQRFSPASVPEAEEVHVARVALRRCRSLLDSSSTLLAEPVPRRLSKDLRWAGGVLGEARDLAVTQSLWEAELGGLVGAGPAKKIGRVLRRGRRAGDAALLEALSTPRWERLLGGWALLLVEAHPSRRGQEAAHEVMPVLLAEAGAQVTALVAEGATEDIDWHRIRRSVKRVRDLNRVAVAVAVPDRSVPVVAWEDLADLLGEHQDRVVTTERVAMLAADLGLEDLDRPLREFRETGRTERLDSAAELLATVIG